MAEAPRHRSYRRHRFRPFHTLELNAVGWAALLGAALPMVAMLALVVQMPLWLSVVASVIVTVAVAVVLDRRKEAVSWVGHNTDLSEAELQTVMADLRALGIEVELSRPIIPGGQDDAGRTELLLGHRHRDRRAVEQSLAARRRDR
jgi:hypothetical protein